MKKTKRITPKNVNKKANKSTGFALYFSFKMPEGIDITPYAIKKENGKNPANLLLNLKLSAIFGSNEPKMFVIKEITKKMAITSATICSCFLFFIWLLWG